MAKIALISSKCIATELFIESALAHAKERLIDIEIELRRDGDFENIDSYDFVLVSPQLRYLLNMNETFARMDSRRIKVISSRDYGRLKGEVVLDLVSPWL